MLVVVPNRMVLLLLLLHRKNKGLRGSCHRRRENKEHTGNNRESPPTLAASRRRARGRHPSDERQRVSLLNGMLFGAGSRRDVMAIGLTRPRGVRGVLPVLLVCNKKNGIRRGENSGEGAEVA